MNFRIFLVLIIGVLLSGSSKLLAQILDSGESPYPILFVHGLNGDEFNAWNPVITHLNTNLDFSVSGSFRAELETPQTLADVTVQLQPTNNTTGDIWTINFFDAELNYSNENGINKQAKAIELAIEKIVSLTGKDKVILVGHSMGGVASTAFFLNTDNQLDRKFNVNNRVAKLLTIGSPLAGSDQAIWEKVIVDVFAGIEIFSPAMRDLNKSTNNHKNVFLFGGNENEVGTFYWDKDVNYNNDPSVDNIKGINEYSIDEWGNDVSFYWLAGVFEPTGGSDREEDDKLCPTENGDCVVELVDQYFSFGESKIIEAGHADRWSCGQRFSFDAIVEGLDEADDFEKAYEIDLFTSYSGFITHQGDRGNNPNVDQDVYAFTASEGFKTSLTISKSPVFTSFYIYKNDRSSIVYSGSLSEGSSRTFEFILNDTDGNSNYYLVIEGAAEPSLTGLDDDNLTACDSNLETARQPYFFRIEEEEIGKTGKLDNYSLSPSGGNTDTPFSFLIDYQSYVNHNTDLHTISLIVDEDKYEMSTLGTDIKSGITYSVRDLTFSEGNHNYYYTAEHLGEVIRYPENSDLTFYVGQSANGWDIETTLDQSYLSPNNPDYGDALTVSAKFSNIGDYEYANVPITAKLINPEGSIEDEDEAQLNNLASGGFEEYDFELTVPNSGEGRYRIEVSANVDLDENRDNNIVTRNFSIGFIPNGTESYRAVTDENLYIVTHDDYENSFDITNEEGLTYTVELRSVDDNNAVQLNVDGSSGNFESYELAIYNDIDIAVDIGTYSDDCNPFFGGCVELAYLQGLVSSSQNVPMFNAIDIFVVRGQTSSTDFTIPSGYGLDDFEVNISAGRSTPYNQIQNWISINNTGGNGQRIDWDIPIDAELGTHEIYLKLEYDNHFPTYNKLYIKVVEPEPILNALPSNSISADDILSLGGNYFGSNEGKVYFNTLLGDIISWSEESIQVEVPEGLTNGTLFVSRTDGSTSNSKSYTVVSSTGDPIVIQNVPNQIIQAGDTLNITNLSNIFFDPNGDNLTYNSESSDELEVLSLELSNGDLVLYADSSADGMYSVVLSATDADQVTVADTFYVNVEGLTRIPTLIYPENDAVEIPLEFTFDWTNVDDANRYKIQAATDSLFNEVIFDDNVFSSEFSSSGLNYLTAYYWRVRAEFSNSVGEWSDTLSFITKAEDILPIMVSLPDSLKGIAGENLSIPIKIDNPSKQNFESFQFALAYDPSKMMIYEVDTTGTLSNAFFLEQNFNTPGEALVNGASSQEINSSGTLLKLNAELLEPDSSRLLWTNFSFNEGLPLLETVNSVVFIEALEDCGDVTANGTVTNDDATFILRHVVNLEHLVGEDSVRADVTGNGWISSYDASQILRFVVGKEYIFNCSSNSKIAYKPVSAQIEWYVDEKNGDSELEVPIFIYSSDAIEAVDILLEVPTGLTFKGIEGVPENWMKLSNINGNRVSISLVGLEQNESNGYALLKFEKAIDNSGSIKAKVRVNDNSYMELNELVLFEKPKDYSLSQNFPNPFNPTTTINYSVPELTDVQLSIYNMLGQRVAHLVNEEQAPGTYSVVWDASSVSSGVYVYQLKAGSQIITRSMMLVK